MEKGQKLFVRSGTKRRLRSLHGIEVEVISIEDNSAFVKCRRCDDGQILKLKRSLLVPREVKDRPEDANTREQEKQAIAKYQRELLDLEDLIPWSCVSSAWRGKRNNWRKRVTTSRSLQDIGEGVKELLRYLVWGKEHRLIHCPFLWGAEIDEVCNESGNHTSFAALWKRLSLEIQQWIQTKHQTGGPLPSNPELTQRTARLALRTLKAAVAKGEDALRQVPLADLVHHDPEALKRLKDLVILEKSKQNSSVGGLTSSSIKKQKQEQC